MIYLSTFILLLTLLFHYLLVKQYLNKEPFICLDTMQNVIEQSVLDNNWQPTADSTSVSYHQAFSLPTLALIAMLPQLMHYISHLHLFMLSSKHSYKPIIRGER